MDLSAPATRPSPKPPYDHSIDPYPISGITRMRVGPWAEQMRKEPSYSQAFPRKALAILEGIRDGVRIGFTGDRTRSRDAPNLGSATKEQWVSDLVTKIIEDDVAAGKKAGPFDAPPTHLGSAAFCVSPIGAVPKPGKAKVRVIHHLSYPFGGDSINGNIAKEDLALARFDDAIRAVVAERARTGRAPLLTKMDVVAAYKQVGVHRDDRPLLGFRWRGKYYCELALPFGLRTAGNRWELYAEALHYFFEKHLGVTLVIHYVDDFLLVDSDLERASAALLAVNELCEKLGVPMAPEKTVGPCTKLIFLGIELDTVAMCMRLGEERVTELRQLLSTWAAAKHITQGGLASLTGKLHFAAKVVRRGRAYLRRLIDLQTSLESQPFNTPSKKHLLERDARQDIIWWRDFIALWNGHSLLYELEWQRAAKLELCTDASVRGYGAHFGKEWFQGQWSPELLKRARHGLQRESIPFLEMYTLVLAALTWGAQWGGKNILFKCDCLPVVMCIESHSTRSADMARLLRLLDTTAARYSFDYRCEHIKGKSNVIADALSRGSYLQELREKYAAAGSSTVPNEQPTVPARLPPLNTL